LHRERSWWPLLLALALPFSALVGALAYENLDAYRAGEFWVRHTYEVLAETDRVLSGVAGAEANQRGYLLAGDTIFLRRYEEASRFARMAEQRLRQLTEDNPRQQERLTRLDPLLRARLAVLARVIEVRQKSSAAAVPEAIRGSRSIELGEQLQRLLTEIRSEEEALLRERSAATDREAGRATTGVVLGTGALVALLGVATLLLRRDQARRQQAEHSLTASEARYRQLVEGVTDYAIFGTDADGHITSWNAGAERIKGYTANEVVGKHLRLLYRPEDRERGEPEQHLAQAREQGHHHDEGWRLRKDGSQFWADASLTAIYAKDGTLQGFSKITRDLTERKHAEEALRESEARYRILSATLERRVEERTQELALANEELTAFAYSVSHDLRAPLRAVDGYGQVLLEDYGEGTSLDREAVRLIGRMKAGTKRMAQLIEDLLNLSRVSRAPLQRSLVNLSTLTRLIGENLHAAEPERKVEWHVSPDLRASGDPQLVRILLENLLGNAWKFTSKVEHACIELGMFDESGNQTFFVRDNGAGFNPEYQDKLFTPFQRLHRESDFPGTGIGLATVARIVHRHGGRSWAEGEPGRGATFYFTLGGEQ
jgi:PAS domain S-box-containing protein